MYSDFNRVMEVGDHKLLSVVGEQSRIKNGARPAKSLEQGT